jgi:hypothetical protein
MAVVNSSDPPLDPWKDALSLTIAKADISSTERTYFDNTTKEDLIRQLKVADQQHQQRSVGRNVSKRMAPFVDCILQYATALDLMSNVQPMPVSLIWGGVRIVLQVGFIITIKVVH